MIVFTSDKVQDTVKINVSKDSLRKVTDELSTKSFDIKTVVNFSKVNETFTYADTTAVCSRNSFEYISFFDEAGFIRNLSVPRSDRTIVNLAEEAKEIRAERKEILLSQLRSGEDAPVGQVNTDFMLIILLAAAFLLTAVTSALKSFQTVTRFFLFKGLNDHSADTGVLFHWQTTLLNLMSFLVISLFVYQAASVQSAIPRGIPGTVFWLICLGIIITALTLRHFVCIVTGNLSGRSDVFNEYLVGIYHSYHFTALILFILIVLVTFTSLLTVKFFVMTGICGIALMYLIRISRLLLIFINRNISIFYLILYLCALEILPVAIIIRYFSALLTG